MQSFMQRKMPFITTGKTACCGVARPTLRASTRGGITWGGRIRIEPHILGTADEQQQGRYDPDG
jgi:hypothetical protein